ncbi:BnaC03g15460D [Brassica napus]|uniref:Uncharacterized protein n=2 Tax=Brassica TaxID=3705 RepID=A0A3P6AF60_BRAOL|nr:unnamed protein product [Brassica napus]CDY51834.1 BnaC03g15460D [Brassica napus]VDC88205.1 unnamed protein product [Brassica oleracea]
MTQFVGISGSVSVVHIDVSSEYTDSMYVSVVFLSSVASPSFNFGAGSVFSRESPHSPFVFVITSHRHNSLGLASCPAKLSVTNYSSDNARSCPRRFGLHSAPPDALNLTVQKAYNLAVKSRTTRSSRLEYGLARSKGLCVPEASPPLCPVSPPSQLCEPLVIYFLNPDRSSDMSFQYVAMGLQFSSGPDESHGSRYGNIGIHFLSRTSVHILSSLIVKSITSPPPRPVIPIPSESRWYSTDTCFGLNQNHLWSLNLPIVLNLSHHSSSKASCLSTVRHRALVQRVHLAQSCDVVLKLPLFVHPSQIHLVSSENFEDVRARAVHARSTSFQTLLFGLINVDYDHFRLVVVTYSGTQLMLPMVLQLSSKTLLLALLSLVLVFCFYNVHQTIEDPSGSILLLLNLASNVIA